MVLSSTDEVQFDTPSSIFNLYAVPALHLDKFVPTGGLCGIPLRVPVCVTSGITFVNIGFTSSSILTVGFL